MMDPRKIGQFLLGEWEKTSQPLNERMSVLPFGQYEDGSVGLAWPGMVAAPVQGMQNFGRYGYDTPEAIRDNAASAFDVAGGAMTGGLGGLATSSADNALGIFGGRLAQTADQAALARAEKMAAEGAPREQIWNDTGWFQGVDGKWRFEIDDSQAKLGPKALQELTAGGDHGSTQRLARGFLQHKDMYDAYPDLAGTTVDARYNANLKDSFKQGEWLNSPDGYGRYPKMTMLTNSLEGDWSPQSVGLHEFQHGVQSREGFSIGGDLSAPDKSLKPKLIEERMRTMGPIARTQGIPEDVMRKVVAKEIDNKTLSMETYKRLAGETEARTVQKRQNLTADERRARPPWLDYDVPEADQIVRFANAPTGAAVPLAMEGQEQDQNPALLDYLRAIGLY